MSARRWITAAAVLVSCAVPELDRTGAIRCGGASDGGLGLCPDGFECRLDRCCPADSAASTCPAVAAASVGSPCTGNPCSSTTSPTACCATVNARGERVLPGGYSTTINCSANSQCGDFGVCLSSAAFGRPVCLRRCTYRPGQVTPCRAAPSELSAAPSGSYVCLPDPEAQSPTDGICLPDCTAVPALCGADQCSPATHTCSNCTADPASCAAGTACNRSTGRCQRCTEDAVNTCGAAVLCVAATGECVRCGPLNRCPMGLSCTAMGRCTPRR